MADIDRLSSLPDSALHLILGFLPLDLAVRTSLLSKRWHYLWTSIFRIDLDENYFTQNRTRKDFLEANMGWLASGIKSTGQKRFVEFGRKFLASYPNNEIESLRICMSDCLTKYRDDVNEWIRFAVDKKVRDLDLSFFDGSKLGDKPYQDVAAYELPPFIYQHKHIRSLKLTATVFRPRSFTDFTSLRSLSISWIKITQELLDILFENCKALDAFTMEKCSCLQPTKFYAENNRLSSLSFEDCLILDNALSISLPILRSFKFYGTMTFMNLEYLSALLDAELDFTLEDEFQPVAHHMSQMLINLKSARALTLCTYTIQVLPPAYQPFHLFKQPLNLKYLTLKTALHRNELPGIAYLVRSYPKLNTITLVMQPTHALTGYQCPYSPVADGENFWGLQEIPFMCFQEYLRVVKVENFRGSKNEIELLRYFMKEARSLHKVILRTAKNGQPSIGTSDVYAAAAQEVQSFEKKSNMVEVVLE
ncbi:putative F-box/LRR-repeat protein At5g54820 [Aristolochia californica]|uniref:putative F-box/LRR-repeat protein At5g54820 n=1 Tax=Aristolochia californica TaxID=171875 RepID=UPI0035E2A31F